MTKCKPTPQEAVEYLREFKDGGEMCCCCGYDIAIAETAVDALEKQIPRPPALDLNAFDMYGDPVPRCQVCGYALDLRMEQYCPCCGQRLTEYPETEVKG